MSALGQKQTCAVQLDMSALLAKADIGQRSDLMNFQSAIVSFDRAHAASLGCVHPREGGEPIQMEPLPAYWR